jgi:predicted RNA-binding Zn-ribbon protein involved in translation (DUF1610 family)
VATADTPQRAWRAACPNCGAPVDFASAASPIAVCSFCRSTLARDGESLRRIGQSAELFDDHSPLQLGVAGRWQGTAFTLVGRLQMRYAEGSWNEWHALFDSGKSAWLSEDNGRYVMAFDAAAPAQTPQADALRAGQSLVLDGRAWQVASVTQARLAAAQGELPFAPNLKDEFVVVDLRNPQDEVATLDYAEPARPKWSIGRSAALSELALTGLREASEKTLGARGVPCPSCGAALEVKLTSTQSIVCHQCHAVVDVSQGVGGDLAHYAQDTAHIEGGQPQLPLGATATLALGGPPKPWQVVGYVERCEIPDSPDDERVFWREYLLYHRAEGFAFLVDAEDGWSWTVPITGAPQMVGESARWRDDSYSKLYAYTGQITYVLGEFYWKLERGERTFNIDYGSGAKRLNREQSGDEVTWSAGQTMDARTIAAAFKLPEAGAAALARDASPLSGGGTLLTKNLIVAIVVIVVLVLMLKDCSRGNCDELRATFGENSNEYQQCLRSGGSGSGIPRSGGGSFGGFGSGGGGHK